MSPSTEVAVAGEGDRGESNARDWYSKLGACLLFPNWGGRRRDNFSSRSVVSAAVGRVGNATGSPRSIWAHAFSEWRDDGHIAFYGAGCVAVEGNRWVKQNVSWQQLSSRYLPERGFELRVLPSGPCHLTCDDVAKQVMSVFATEPRRAKV
eukprot:GFKZ01010864.1.p1 GENE.GFKZ01010864.1~~GFKZ01010864.1.p1  ORF type:complete len:151 (-),score=2.61 GFKZ01010864.1:250-702(-)